MFVTDNSLQAAKNYVNQQLQSLYSERERQLIFKEMILTRFGWSSSDWLLGKDTRLSESDLLYVRSVVKRLQQEEPFQYIMGKTTFYGLEMVIRPGALIPRPETEELVAWVVSEYREGKVLDACTGSGCMALALQSQFPNAQVEAWDISEEALMLAKENAKNLGLNAQFSAVDVLKKWPLQDESLSVVMSNPPYIAESESDEMSRNVLAYEPHLALFAPNENPIVFYERIAAESARVLQSKGQLFFEIHEKCGQEVTNMLRETGWETVTLQKDLQGKNRMIKALKGS
jgi:release factor glutamine methyltransferase